MSKFNDPAFEADHEDDTDITAEDLGNDGARDPELEEEEGEQIEKAPAKKAAGKKEESEEEEEESEEEEEESEEEEEDKAAGDKNAQLAKKLARTARARAKLEDEVRELRGRLSQQDQTRSEAAKEQLEKLETRLDTLYEEVEEHRSRGETKLAAQKQREIDKINSGMTRQQAAAIAAKQALEAGELRVYNTMVSELESTDPRFDKDHDDFDEDLVNDVQDLVEGFEAKGVALSEALRRACKIVLREDVFSKNYRANRPDLKKADTPKARKTDIKKNLEAARRTPPDEPGSNREKAAELPDMERISEKDFDALPESVLNRLLGNA